MARGARKAGKAKTVESLKHKSARRRNIPTAETQSFLADEEQAPTTLRYPRNSDLDPQLVWRGKDAEDDAEALSVDAVPIYIQEKIHPQAIIADLQRRSRAAREARRDRGEAQGEDAQFGFDAFWSDFNGLEDREAEFEFYAHDRSWTNRMILGDSLLVMASLAEKEALRGQVQCIYFDPPYGIKFNSNWQVSTKSRDVKDGKLDQVAREPEVVKAFRDTWSDGINSYLSYLRDRLTAARELLAESGSIFFQIGDENAHMVRALMDEVFGRMNFISQITFVKTGGQTTKHIAGVSDHIIWYAKKFDDVKFRKVLIEKQLEDDKSGVYRCIFDEYFNVIRLSNVDLHNASSDRVFRLDNALSQRPPGDFPVHYKGRVFRPGRGYWKSSEEGMNRLCRAGRINDARNSLTYIRYLKDFPAKEISNVWTDMGSGSFTEEKIYVVQSAAKLIQRCLLMTTDPGDLVLDPTCGSGTTAYVAEQWGRRWITIDTSRVALALTRQRLMAARFTYYLLQDSLDGAEREGELTGQAPIRGPFGSRIRQGFVYGRVPHITLKSIANNVEIDTIWDTWKETLDSLRAMLNESLEKAWQEWEIPRYAAWPWSDKATKAHGEALTAKREMTAQLDAAQGLGGPMAGNLKAVRENWNATAAKALKALNAETGESFTLDSLPEVPGEPWSEEAAKLHTQWWEARRARQGEIDASIARNAETEYLYDRPYEDKSKVRVAGPFTVESLSPHRMLSPDEDSDEMLAALREEAEEDGRELLPRSRTVKPDGEDAPRGDDDFVRVVLDNLKRAGVQNTKKDERLTFTELKPWAGGRHVHAEGRYEESGKERRAAVFIGPEYGTVSWAMVREAAREAVELFDTLIVCGFAFEPQLNEDKFQSLGRLTVLKARMNQDLHMADRLRSTGAGNLFVVFGEPDIDWRRRDDGLLEVEIRGLDVFDPTTGEVRASPLDDIACWFLDTDYSGDSFFVRHAYFLGGNDPYQRLKTTLKAEIDEEAWESLYSPISAPFPVPESGRIAVKVINHYGDEVMKVYDVA